MNIDKALDHFKFKLKNVWNPTEADVDAINSIMDYVEIQQSKSMSENESLAKLWMHQMILLNTCNLYSAERSIQVIDEILDKSVYEWCLRLRNEIGVMRFNALSLQSDSRVSKDILSRSYTQKIISDIINKKETELLKELQTEISEDKIIKFVEKQVNRIINKYDK
jgi:hypothetical protein